MNVPEEFRYTQEHEWIRVLEGGVLRIGITDYAQEQLGDVVFVELPEVGVEVEAEGMLAEVESTKSVAEVYAPVAGVVQAVNPNLEENPDLVNRDPYDEGWFVEIQPAESVSLDGFLDAAGYRSLIE